ncbi:hypothetical protein [Sphingobacterium paludis]|uniref:Uncharacterized protein n=1 Tax=Sphingobacterium paludis TaxID=1476465 RepID=A0A4R7CWZ8_9SPHI|nr:hypothetical protein [Sphingobacterium paludis]TDS09790.1 hypothetical protein B0I21_11067 [Sphingobacterium paludis]
MLYSSGHCEDHTYRVQYVKSKSGSFGLYEYPEENPILVTNEDGSIQRKDITKTSVFQGIPIS